MKETVGKSPDVQMPTGTRQGRRRTSRVTSCLSLQRVSWDMVLSMLEAGKSWANQDELVAQEWGSGLGYLESGVHTLSPALSEGSQLLVGPYGNAEWDLGSSQYHRDAENLEI